MPLTPADVHNVAFSKPPIGKRGYNEDEVDQFLDLVEDTLAQLQEENDDLSQRVDELETQLKDGPSAGAVATTGTAPKGVDESALRRQIEDKIRAEYKTKLEDAQKATTKAQNDAKSVQDQLQKAQAEAKSAREEAEKAKASAKSGSGSPAPAAPATGGAASADTHMQAAKVLGLAQEMADRLTTDAQAESRSMLDEAREAAEKQISEANASSNKTLEEARQRAEKQISEAEARAQKQLSEAEVRAQKQLSEADARAKHLVAEAEKKSAATIADSTARAEAQIRQAEDKANALQADAERKHTETMAAVKEQQHALEIRIAELQTFEREYRTRLKSLLEGQLEELNSRGSSAPTGNANKSNNQNS